MDNKDFKSVTGSGNLPEMGDEKFYPDELTEHYELLELMSESEEGQTLLVKRRTDGRLCVAKCYLPESPLFARTEPDALRNISSLLMPAFVSEITDTKMRCILREYIPGENLKKAAETRRFTCGEIIGTGISLCEQLAQLHGMEPPIIHRDIKPENVILRPDGKTSLIDFGIAGEYKEGSSDTVLFGTRGFSPPEQFGFSVTDARSDIYALGRLLAWLYTGGEDAKTAGTVAELRETDETAPHTPGDTAVSSALLKVIEKCSAFDPKDRFDNVRQVREALRAAASGKEETESPDVMPGRGNAGRQKRAVLAILAGCVLIAAVLLAGLLGRSGRRVQFAEPLIEEAARKNLGLEEGRRLTKSDLARIKGLYIVADRAFSGPDEFYAAVNELYTGGEIVHGSLSSLEDIKAMTGLEQICIAAAELRGIEEIEGLKELNKLEIKHNYVEDISPLAGMTKVTSVGINDNPVRDISPLVHCPNLAFLDLCNVRTYDPSVIEELGNFDYLDLSNPTDSYRYLSGKSVLSLRLAWTGLSSLDDLEGVTRLEDLDISHTDVGDLSKLEEHAGLKRLNIAGIPAQDLSVLKVLPQLETVTISSEMESLAPAPEEVGFEIRYE